MSKINDLLSNIQSECKSINENASELREAISELSPTNEDDLFSLIDNIKESTKEIDSEVDNIDSAVDSLEDEIEELESSSDVDTDIQTMSGNFSYKTDNPRDEDVMEVFVKCIQEIQPAKLIELLQRNLNHSIDKVIQKGKDDAKDVPVAA